MLLTNRSGVCSGKALGFFESEMFLYPQRFRGLLDFFKGIRWMDGWMDGWMVIPFPDVGMLPYGWKYNDPNVLLEPPMP